MAEASVDREDVGIEDKWDLEALYAHDRDWECDFEAAQEMPKEVASYSGKLGSADILAGALQTWFVANRQMEKLWVYAHLRSDEDLSNSHYEKMKERARSLYVELDTAGSYLAPEILSLDEERVREWMEEDTFALYRVWLQDILRHGKTHRAQFRNLFAQGLLQDVPVLGPSRDLLHDQSDGRLQILEHRTFSFQSRSA